LLNIRAKRAVVAGLLAMVASHVVLFWSLREQVREGYSDFASFYGAGRILHSGLHDKIYDYQTQWDMQRSFAPKVVIRHGPLLYNHAPFEAWLFALFGGLPYPIAFVLWNVVNLGMLGAIAWLMRTYVPGGFAFVLLLGLAFFPVLLVFVQGQDSMLLLLLLVLAFRALKLRREFAAGIFLGLALLKPHLVLPLALIFLFRAQIRVLAGFAISAIAVFIASVAAVGWHDTLNYPRYVWKLSQQHAIGAITPVNMPNVRGLLDPLFSGYHIVVPIVSVAVALFLSYLAARVWNRLSDNAKIPDVVATDLGFSFAVIVTVLVSYHLYAYDATLALLPIIVLSGLVLSDRRPARPATMWSIALLLFTPLWAALLFWARHLNLMALVFGFFGWAILRICSETAHRDFPVPARKESALGAPQLP
jgi:glycosyl transferase family 87